MPEETPSKKYRTTIKQRKYRRRRYHDMTPEQKVLELKRVQTWKETHPEQTAQYLRNYKASHPLTEEQREKLRARDRKRYQALSDEERAHHNVIDYESKARKRFYFENEATPEEREGHRLSELGRIAKQSARRRMIALDTLYEVQQEIQDDDMGSQNQVAQEDETPRAGGNRASTSERSRDGN